MVKFENRISVVVLILCFPCTLLAQEIPDGNNDLIKAVRDEAERLKEDNPSPTFQILESKATASSLGLSGDQADLILRLDDFTNEIVRTWLLRGLDAAIPPADLGERLAESGLRRRKLIFEHAEQIALIAILTGRQAENLRAKREDQPPKENTAPSKRKWNASGFAPHGSQAEMASKIAAIRIEAERLKDNNPSPTFRMLESKTTERSLGLSGDQAKLVRRLDEFTNEIVRAWLLRGLDATDPPADLGERLAETGTRHRSLIYEHSEQIALIAILSTQQAEDFKIALWKSLGHFALLDRELGARIKITEHQRIEIENRIKQTRQINEQAENDFGDLRLLHNRGNDDLALQADQEIRNISKTAEDLVWEVLTPTQLSKLERMLNESLVPLKRPVPKMLKPEAKAKREPRDL